MKKSFILLLAVALVLSGCAGQPEEPMIRVGLCLPSAEVPYAQALRQELVRSGCYVNLLVGKQNQSLQNRQVAQLVQEQYDLLIIEPVIQAATDSLLEGVEAVGIPAILLNTRSQSARARGQVCRVGFSEEQAGSLQGQCILATPDRGDINGDGQVACAILSGPEDLVDTPVHSSACMAALHDAGIRVQLLAQVYGDHSPARGQALTEGLLDRFANEIEVLFCGNGQLALGALTALEAAGRSVNEDIYVVSIGGGEKISQRIAAGAMTGAVMADYDVMAVQVTRAAEALLSGRPLPQVSAPYTLKQAQNIRGKKISSRGCVHSIAISLPSTGSKAAPYQ